MRKHFIILLTTVSLLVIPATAQQNSLELKCDNYSDGSIAPGETANCLLKSFPSDFKWQESEFDWEASPGKVVQQSIESAQISVPKQYSTDRLSVKVEITDGSGQVHEAETTAKLEKQQEKDEENQTYKLPVESPDENESQEQPKLPKPKVHCADKVKSGKKTTCDVTYRSDIKQPNYEWNTEGEGKISGELSHGTYQAPNIEENNTVKVSLSLYSSSTTTSSSEKIVVIPNSDQKNLEEKEDRNEQKIQEQQETIKEQRQKLEQKESTINDLKNTIQELRKQLNNTREKDSDREENETQETEKNPETGGENLKTSNQSKKVDEDSDLERRENKTSESNNQKDEQEPESENRTNENPQNETNNSNADERLREENSEGLIETLRSLFG